MNWLWIHYTDLSWWAMGLWFIYIVYFIIRAIYIWNETSDDGILEGYKTVFLGRGQTVFRLYHLVRMILDIPPAVLGLLFPLLQKFLTLKLYEFKK